MDLRFSGLYLVYKDLIVLYNNAVEHVVEYCGIIYPILSKITQASLDLAAIWVLFLAVVVVCACYTSSWTRACHITNTPQLYITVSLLSILFHPCVGISTSLSEVEPILQRINGEWPIVYVTEGVADKLCSIYCSHDIRCYSCGCWRYISYCQGSFTKMIDILPIIVKVVHETL